MCVDFIGINEGLSSVILRTTTTDPRGRPRQSSHTLITPRFASPARLSSIVRQAYLLIQHSRSRAWQTIYFRWDTVLHLCH